MEERIRQRVPVQEKTLRFQSTWYSDHRSDKYKIKVLEAASLTCGKLFGISIHAGVFLGEKMLGTPRETRLMKAGERIEWGSAKDDTFEFDIELQHLPRDAKLCLAIVGLWVNPKGNMKKKKKYSHPLAWVNISVMDHKGFLRQGKETLLSWSYDEDEDEKEKQILLPLGTTTRNIDGHKAQLPRLAIDFLRYDKSTSAVHLQYPSDEKLIGGQYDGKSDEAVQRKWNDNAQTNTRRLNTIARKDPLYKLEDDDRKFLNEFKWYAKDQPTALPKCLAAVDWKTNDDAHLVVDMLRLWKPLSPEDALVLLDCGFADATTRSHAVRLMKTLTNEKLLMYLLQLVQVLKYELYLDCDLARFLLERAVENRRVGHFFFWYLRSEMHRPEAKIRYGLLLEAYCQGCSGHMQELKLQVTAMNELLKIADSIKPHNISKKDKIVKVKSLLQNVEIGRFQLPYDPRINVNHVECPRVMDSKKLPLWLTFKNEDPKASETGDTEVNIIFKAGDDLRQDMLTLQLIRIMDQLWMSEGIDLQMNAYECVSTGDEVGMLQVVMNAKTIASIQGGARDALKDDPLYKWLKSQNPSEVELKQAEDNFMKSCAGYCVATYILGIGDRHNDNIMVTRDGKLFHIDFGHFLGNWKSKFGIKRERVKFILTPDFVYALSGGKGAKSQEYIEFKELCKKAFLIVRKQADLFINLLNMMLSTGIPELRTHDDVAYLQNTLFLDQSEEEAGESFKAEIDQALKDSWSVRVNWMAHIAAH